MNASQLPSCSPSFGDGHWAYTSSRLQLLSSISSYPSLIYIYLWDSSFCSLVGFIRVGSNKDCANQEFSTLPKWIWTRRARMSHHVLWTWAQIVISISPLALTKTSFINFSTRHHASLLTVAFSSPSYCTSISLPLVSHFLQRCLISFSRTLE